MQIHRFRDAAAMALEGKGETRYMTAATAREVARGLVAIADSIERETFANSSGLTMQFRTAHEPSELGELRLTAALPGAERYIASHFSAPWPAAPDGRYRVALYKGTFGTSPVVYRQDRFSDHKTLKAAVRRLAHIIARQGRRGYTGERFDAAYIVSPEGERWPLNKARAILAGRHD